MGSSGEDSFFDAAERVAQIGSWEWAPDTGELRLSDNVFRLFGLEPGAVPPTMERALAAAHPDDLDRYRREVERIMDGDDRRPFDYRIIRTDGEVRRMRLTVAEVEGNTGPRRVLGAVQDVTEIRAVERMIAAHIAVSDALSEWESFDLGAELLLSKLGTAIEFEIGALWAPRKPMSETDLREDWRDLGSEDEVNGGRRHLISAAKIRGAVAVPAVHGDDVLAVLGFGARREIELADRMPSLLGIGYEIGEFLVRRRGELGAPPLTPRELEVLEHGAQGHSRPEIAASLNISPATVKTHFEHIYAKLGVSDRAAAVARAVRDGLID
jgi:PAS domain S-box-containing protein